VIHLGQEEKRYLKVKFYAKGLEGNPLGSPADRELAIYLPPNYFKESKRYPVIYFLHGYGSNSDRLTVYEDAESFWGKETAERLKLLGVNLDVFPSYKRFDKLILNGEMEPVIFVQPDASLHLKPIHDMSVFGELYAKETKGSFYVNSPYAGNYEDYIVKDVIEYVDSNFRTIPDRSYRAIMGVSMGALGTINLSAKHPNKFIVASALSGAPTLSYILSEHEFLRHIKEPPNLAPGLSKLGVPQDMLNEFARKFWDDALDTMELIFSPKENRLRPTVKEEADGTITYDRLAFKNLKENYKKYAVNYTLEHLEVFKEVNLQLKCNLYDPLAPTVELFHEFLELLKIPHNYELYVGKEYEFSPHILGCLLQIIPAMKFCIKHFGH